MNRTAQVTELMSRVTSHRKAFEAAQAAGRTVEAECHREWAATYLAMAQRIAGSA